LLTAVDEKEVNWKESQPCERLNFSPVSASRSVALAPTAAVVSVRGRIVCVRGVFKSPGRINPSSISGEGDCALLREKLRGLGFKDTLLLLLVAVPLLPRRSRCSFFSLRFLGLGHCGDRLWTCGWVDGAWRDAAVMNGWVDGCAGGWMRVDG